MKFWLNEYHLQVLDDEKTVLRSPCAGDCQEGPFGAGVPQAVGPGRAGELAGVGGGPVVARRDQITQLRQKKM